MTFEDMQKAWRSQGGPPKVNLNANLVLKEVQRNKEYFEATVFWRDVREVGVALLMAGFFIYMADRTDPWPNVVLVLACLWMAGFMLRDRWAQRKKQPLPGDPLRTCIKASLQQVNHQIWLLKGVLWWYLLPPTLGLAFGLAHGVRRMQSAGVPVGWLGPGMFIGIVAVVVGGVYWLNQYTVKEGLIPRRRELEELLASLDQAE